MWLMAALSKKQLIVKLKKIATWHLLFKAQEKGINMAVIFNSKRISSELNIDYRPNAIKCFYTTQLKEGKLLCKLMEVFC